MIKRMWEQASKAAEKTPAERNRYVDFLRALSILAVVLGHWIMAAPFWDGDKASIHHLLDIQPWARWLTWIFQVMPVFFFVGGFSNGVSWDRAVREKSGYANWLAARFQRLLAPTIPLIVLWVFLALLAPRLGISTPALDIASRIALVPVWFLAIYFIIVMLVPVTRALWKHYGYASVVAPIVLAAIGDWIFFNTSFGLLSWLNYLFVWSAVHQLGYAWQQEKIGGNARAGVSFAWGALGLLLLVLLTRYGPYPLSLVGVPSQAVSNTEPPKLPLLALAMAQIGFLLALEGPLRRWLDKGRVWTSTVLINGLIMPVFLWHSTIMMIVIGACFVAAPDWLSVEPGSTEWWMHRPVWVLVYAGVMVLTLPLCLASERLMTARAATGSSPILLGLSAVLMCSGLALLAAGGILQSGGDAINWWAAGLPLLSGLILFTMSSQKTE